MSTTTASLPTEVKEARLERTRARPFVKWAGGKRSLISEIMRRLPASIDEREYWEPFVGGGALFFALENRIRQAHLSDVNQDLVLTYNMVRKEPEKVIALLAEHERRHHDRHYYYTVRSRDKSPDPIEAAARFIYLNKTCYNGLYRVNRQGQFNVPRGSYKNPTICDEDNLHAASEALKKAKMIVRDFSSIKPGDGDFVYCDPPYDGTFAGYASDGFADHDQNRLRDAALRWHDIGAHVMISNSDTPLVRDLYDGCDPFVIREVAAPRNINSNGNGRGPTSELIITTYGGIPG